MALLQGSNWLNDAVISFYFEWLRRQGAAYGRDDILLVMPDIAQMAAALPPADAKAFLGEVVNVDHRHVRTKRLPNKAQTGMASLGMCALQQALCTCSA